jgi:dolichol-phosphate mannosyltransferase
MSVWVVIPTYDEAANIEPVVTAVRTALAGAPEGLRILIVDDGSPDGTGEIADGLATRHAEVEVLHRPAKGGLGAAYVAGFDHALARGATYVLEMDADLSHDPAALPRLLDPARAGADVVLGSRYVDGGGVEDWPASRRLVSRLGCWYARTVLGAPVRDLTGGFKCFRATSLLALDHHSARAHGYAFQVELTQRALRLGQRVVEVPIVFRDRQAGRSKMSGGIALEAAWRVLALRLHPWSGPREPARRPRRAAADYR